MMRITYTGIGALASLWLAGCATGGTDTPVGERPMEMKETEYLREVKVPIQGRSGSKTKGTATFHAMQDQVHMILEVENAPPGLHAVHLHEKADCSSKDAKSAGDHWNPTSEKHGQLDKTEHAHHGDIGNLKVGADGKGRLEFMTRQWTLGGRSDTNVLDHAIVIHAKQDDFKSQPAGNAGDRIGCGEIRH